MVKNVIAIILVFIAGIAAGWFLKPKPKDPYYHNNQLLETLAFVRSSTIMLNMPKEKLSEDAEKLAWSFLEKGLADAQRLIDKGAKIPEAAYLLTIDFKKSFQEASKLAELRGRSDLVKISKSIENFLDDHKNIADW